MTQDWRAAMIERIRKLIAEAEPAAIEEVKWRKPSNPDGVPTWSYHGLICTGETYKDKVKITFAHGAALDDPDSLFPQGQQGGTRRAIDLRAGERFDECAFKALVRAAAAHNESKKKGL